MIAGDGHWFLAFYYKDDLTENPSIIFIDTEDCVLYPLYESFEHMISYLDPETKDNINEQIQGSGILMTKAMIQVGKENTINEILAKEISYLDLVSYGKKAIETYFHFEEIPDFPFPGLSPTLYPSWEEEDGNGSLVLYADFNFIPQAAIYLSVNTDYLMEEMEKVVEHANNDVGHQMFEISYSAEEDYDYMLSTGLVVNPEEINNLYDCLEYISLTYIYPVFISALRFAALRHQEDLKQLIEDMNEIMYGESENQENA